MLSDVGAAWLGAYTGALPTGLSPVERVVAAGVLNLPRWLAHALMARGLGFRPNNEAATPENCFFFLFFSRMRTSFGSRIRRGLPQPSTAWALSPRQPASSPDLPLCPPLHQTTTPPTPEKKYLPGEGPCGKGTGRGRAGMVAGGWGGWAFGSDNGKHSFSLRVSVHQ